MNDIRKTVLNTIKTHGLIHRGDFVLLGLSGGPDSLCLLHVLMDLQDELGFELAAVHVNHGIRGKEADEDAAWVTSYCGQVGVSSIRVEANVPAYARHAHLTEEEAGRRVRREIFAYLAYGLVGNNVHERHPAWPLRNSYKGVGGIKATPKAVRIAVAHNMDDQAETVLMRILRGTGVHGLAGMQYESPLTDALQRVGWGIKNPLLQQNAKDLDISMIRPLLDVPRTDIEQYCTENQLQPRIDQTNAETDHTRNKIRLQLIPQLEADFNPNIKETLVRLAANAAEDDAALSASAASAAKDSEKILQLARFDAEAGRPDRRVSPALSRIELDAAALRSLQPAVFKRVIVNEFDKLGLSEGISAVHLNALHAAVLKNVGGKTIEFPGGYTATLRAGTLTLSC